MELVGIELETFGGREHSGSPPAKSRAQPAPANRFWFAGSGGARDLRKKVGGASRDRTDDLIVANDALSQLSYSPTRLTILTEACDGSDLRFVICDL